MSGPISERVVATHTVRGRQFEVTRLAWRDTDGLSYDVADVITGAPLHNESFDDEPNVEHIADLLDNIAQGLTDGDLDDVLSGHEDDLRAVIAATSPNL